ILTVVSFVIAGLAFLFKWGIRFRLVGITGFLVVLTVGLFALNFGLLSSKLIPGAVKFSLVYDNGGNNAVIALAPEVTESEVEATLLQAASNLSSYGRGSSAGDNKFTIRARTIIHPEPGISVPLYLGEVRKSLAFEDQATPETRIFSKNFAKLGINDQ
ncbi:MAG: Ycf51 family protein, partial [Spirulinaceae cyanobacterium]